MAKKPIHPIDDIKAAVGMMRAGGLTGDQIAALLSVSKSTLSRHYSQEMENGKAAVIAKISEGVIHRAINGDNASAFFYLKTQAGWRETSVQEHTGPGGGAVKIESSIDYASLSTEVLEALRNAGRPAEDG